ncbi:MAG: hypothetical protein JWQ66_3248 [Mucilaginibacter sp.]|nr:hypothetical protein [Mucilaginibacter sp.]
MIGRANERLLCTHRFAGYLTAHTENSVADLANFSLSTVFLKIISPGREKRYKPAQLCTFAEIDLKFLPVLPPNMTVPALLKYLGVSFTGNYRFVDRSVYEKLKHGLDYITAIYKRPYEKADPLNYASVAREVRVLNNTKECHPALINENQYFFLSDWKRQEFYDESVQLLVKNYAVFPRNYLEQLLEAMRRTPQARNSDLLRFYPFIFEQMLSVLKLCMVSEEGQIKFVKSDAPVFVISNEYEFRLSQLRKLPVLAYYAKKLEPDHGGLKGTALSFKEQRLYTKGGEDKTPYFRDLLGKRMFYLLLEITRNSVSADYFENPARIADLAKRLAYLRFEAVDVIRREISSDHFTEPILDQRKFDTEDGCLYLLKDLSFNEQAEAIARELFRNGQLTQTIELVLFHRTEASLELDARKHQDGELEMFQRFWIADYTHRFARFVKKITDAFHIPYPKGDPDWYRYNKLHQSRLIQEASDNGTLPELQEIIAVERARFDKGVFAYFKLEIDDSMYDQAIARLRLILEPLKGESADSFRKRLGSLVGRLGIEKKLSRLEADIKAAYADAFAVQVSGVAVLAKTEQVAVDADVERIFQSIQNLKDKQQHNFTAQHDLSVKPVPVKTKKVIFQGQTLPGAGSEVTGASGEVDVLNLMIRHFLTLGKAERKKALKDVLRLILSKSKDDRATVAKLEGYYKECLKQVENDEALTRTLIPFYYVTLHHKYAFVDLFAWYEGRAMMVEVKSTSSAGRNDF